ncbi:MAG: hypothetical protein SynsKO_42840 [Synoicihabitans sp.]
MVAQPAPAHSVAKGEYNQFGAYEVSEWPDFAGVELSTTHVSGSVYMIQRPGGGGNIGVYVGEEGVLLVDALYPAFGEKIIAEVAKLTDHPIRFVVNTHIHIDHIGANEALAENGATILAHESVRQRMLKRLRWPRHHGSLGPQPPAAARPLITYREAINFHFEDEEVQAFLAPPAHTDGDTFVYFPSANVMHLGDVFRTTSYPVIDVYNGGSVQGTIDALDLAIELADSDTKIIPGHGLDVVGIDELTTFRDMIVTVRDRVLAMIEKGMVLEHVMAAAPTADFDAQWGKEKGWLAVDFIPIVFTELGGDVRYRGHQH